MDCRRKCLFVPGKIILGLLKDYFKIILRFVVENNSKIKIESRHGFGVAIYHDAVIMTITAVRNDFTIILRLFEDQNPKTIYFTLCSAMTVDSKTMANL